MHREHERQLEEKMEREKLAAIRNAAQERYRLGHAGVFTKQLNKEVDVLPL